MWFGRVMRPRVSVRGRMRLVRAVGGGRGKGSCILD